MRREIVPRRDPVHFDLDGYPLCEARAAGAYVVESVEHVTCPRCAALAPRLVVPLTRAVN